MTEPSTVRLVVIGLILIALASVGGAIFLEATGHDAGQAWTIATASLTGLAALLVNTRTGADPTVDAVADQARAAGAAQTEAEILQLDKTPAVKAPTTRRSK